MDFELIGEISEVKTIAVGTGVRDRARPRKVYGRGRWRKVKGVAQVKRTPTLRNFRPKEDAAILKPLFAQGAILISKTSIHELSYGHTTNDLGKAVVNREHWTNSDVKPACCSRSLAPNLVG